MQFPIGNTLIIEGMIDRLDTQILSIATYKITIKTFVQYAAAKALVQDITINKLKEAAANKKKRSKQTVRLSCVCPETWEIYQEAQRIAKRAKQKVIDNKRKAAAKKVAGKGKGKANNKSDGGCCTQVELMGAAAYI